MALVGLLASACHAGPAGTPVSATPAEAPVLGPARASLCSPPGPTPGTPITDPQGPYFHRTLIGRTADGVTVTDARVVLDHASVPDGVRAPDGRELIYYVNGEDASLWVAEVRGNAASALGPITMDGIRRPSAVVDPDVVVVNGRIRMVYLSGFGTSGAVPAAICLAESSDGVLFTSIGPALTLGSEFLTDPSIVRLARGDWLMALSAGQQTVLARSADGQTFTTTDRVTFGGVPELAALADGRVRLYVCARGIVSYVSSDEGATWTAEATVVAGPSLTCDPSLVAGTNLFVYKSGY